MGLLYKALSIHPTTTEEFHDLIKRKDLRDITIRVGIEYVGEMTLVTPMRRYVEFLAQKRRLKRHFGRSFTDFTYLNKEQERIKEDAELMRYAIDQKLKFESEGRECKIVMGEKTLNKEAEQEWLEKAKRLVA